MAISGEVILKVTPEQLQTKAQVTTNHINQLKTAFENIGNNNIHIYY